MSSNRPQETVESDEDEEDEEEVVEDEEGRSRNLSDDDGQRKKFQEKIAPLHSSPSGSPEPQVTSGMFKGFSFKKRSTTNKPQIRQRTSDFS